MSVTIIKETPLSEDEWVAVINGMLAKLKHWLRKVQLPCLVKDDKITVPIGVIEYSVRVTDKTTVISRDFTRETLKRYNMVLGFCDQGTQGDRYIWGIDRDANWLLIKIESALLKPGGNTATKISIEATTIKKLLQSRRSTPQTIIKGINDFCKRTENHMAERRINFAACADDIRKLSECCIQNYPTLTKEIRNERVEVNAKGIEPGRLLEGIASGKIRISAHNMKGWTPNKRVSHLDVKLRGSEKVCPECAAIYTNDCPVCKSKREADEKAKE